MRLPAYRIGLALAAATAAVAPASAAPGPETIIIRNVSVIPLAGARDIVHSRDVVIRGDRIAAIGPSGRLRLPRGARLIEGRGRFLIPGLSDSHVHLEYSQDPSVLGLFLESGVTSVRSMDGRPYIADWRDRVRDGQLLGPTIFTAGPIIDGSPPARSDNLAVADADAARKAVKTQAARGYDFIKVYTNLSMAAFEAIVAAAKESRLRVAGHVPRGVELASATRTMWSIEHLGDFAAKVIPPSASVPGWARRGLAGPMDRAAANQLGADLAAAGTWVVPTLIQQDRAIGGPNLIRAWSGEPGIRTLPPAILSMWTSAAGRYAGRLGPVDWAMVDQARRNRLALVGIMHRHGVRIALGTDTPNPFVAMGASVHLELANLVAAGLTPREALTTATINAARMVGVDRDRGTIEAGKRADLVLLSANPLASIANSRKIEGVVAGGRWLDRAALDELPKKLAVP